MKDAHAAGHRFEKCPECGGLWVEEGQLACMYNDLAGPFARPEFGPAIVAEVDEIAAGEQSRRCLSCERIMRRCLLQLVTVHRCDEHGIWFDRNELQDVLEKVALAAAAAR